MDLSRAQLDAFRGLHYFHENLNIHIKSSTAGIILLADAAGTNTDPHHMGELIKKSHPAWNSPPVHQLNLDIYKRIYCSVGAYAIVAIFSALDDFLAGLEADISRFEARGSTVIRQPKIAANDQAEPIESLSTPKLAAAVADAAARALGRQTREHIFKESRHVFQDRADRYPISAQKNLRFMPRCRAWLGHGARYCLSHHALGES